MNALHSAPGTGIGYNPGVTNRAGELFAQGISQAGDAVSSAIQQFAKNREERDFLDQQREGVAAELGKYKNFEVEAKDDTSPAGQAIKTFANWDNLSLGKQKAALMDGRLLIQKSEAQQVRAEENQYRLLAVQHQQAQEERAERQLIETNRHSLVLEGIAKRNAAANEGTRTDMIQQRALEEARRAQEDQRLTDFQNLSAPQPTGISPMQGDAARFLLSLPGEPNSRPDFSQSDSRQPLVPQSIERIAELARTTGAFRDPRYAAYMKDLRLGSRDAAFTPTADTVRVGKWNVPWVRTSSGQVQLLEELGTDDDGAPNPRFNRPPTVTITTKDKDGNTVTRKLTEAEAAALPPTVPVQIQKDMALLLKLIAQDEGDIAGGKLNPWFSFDRVKRLKENKAKLEALQRNYGASPAPTSGGQPIKYKLVNGQLVQD